MPKHQGPYMYRRHQSRYRGVLSLLDLLEQLTVHGNLAAQQLYLGVSPFDQTAKFTNQLCALCSKGCESLVLICEISAGSGVTGKLGVAGGRAANVVLQACNAGSVSSAASLQRGKLLRVVMGVFLLGGPVIKHSSRFNFCSSLRFLRMRYSLF